MARRLPLSKLHIIKRLQWARNHMSYDDKWMAALFSDEEKWNLDGPDGNIKYWHDLRKEPVSLFSRQSGGGSVMVWAAFGFNGKVGLAFLDGRQNSPKYRNTRKSSYAICRKHRGRKLGISA
ncbi:Transposable element Tc3 transposase [Araneus ventricosus]|nr:Transposable element Tc3 transposase [Araneus ventricosus]